MSSGRAAGLSIALVLSACGAAQPGETSLHPAATPARPTTSATAAGAARPLDDRLVLEATEPGTIAVTIEASWPAVSTTEPYPQEKLAIGWLRASEVDHGGPSMEGFIQLLPRMRVFDVRGLVSGGRLTLRVPDEPVALFAILDREMQFLPTLLGKGAASSAMGFAEVEAMRGKVAKLALEATTPKPEGTEPCAGDRFQLLEVDGGGAEGAVRGTKRRLCAWLPKSYAKDKARRYPVVYALPGLASSDVAPLRGRDHFGELMDDVAAAAKREVIVVGVDTRSPRGSSYFADSSVQGPWERFGAETMVKAVDARLRTIARSDARALVGHSTGGFDAVSLAMRHPDVFGAVGASSPDALDLDTWLWEPGGEVKRTWLGWMRLEDAMGGAGQLTSYGAAWSPDASAARGFAWPVDLKTARRNEAGATAWKAASPIAWLETPDGLSRAKKLSGRIFLTCGTKDEPRLFAPTQSYVSALGRKGVEVKWAPTDLGHLGAKRERLTPLLGFVLDRLASK